MRPTGNCRPALALRLTAFLAVFPLPRPDILEIGEAEEACLEARRDFQGSDAGASYPEPPFYWLARPLRGAPKRVACHTCAPPPVHSAPMAPKKADKKPAAKTTKPAVKKGKKKSKARAALRPA